MELIYYFMVGATFLMYAGAVLFCVWAIWLLYNMAFADIIERRRAVIASRKKWKE